ncbi:MAG TPA: hypothetical protein PKA00_07030 [Saprospiraceae bacterium]|nr:hypothetical protein [Saprospiraceae bacterium]HMQ82642.1 hypothetical protein [Saprospiraceae bacterium]
MKNQKAPLKFEDFAAKAEVISNQNMLAIKGGEDFIVEDDLIFFVVEDDLIF